jgi:hypothetical protein
MKISANKRSYISDLWFKSELKQSKPNLVLNYTEQGNNYYFTIGIYSFNSFNGISHVEPLPNMNKLSFSEIESLLK